MKPVWHILDDGEFALVLANAAHVKNVPGRKTDVNDAMWLAELLAHGLIRASFVPDTQTQEMRNLLRTRKQLVREQSSHVQRVQRTLEDANIKLDSVLTDLMGKSGRAMIEALIAGETNPAKLASLADRRVKASHEEFREALRGRVTKHHRFLLRLHLNQIDALDAAMATVDAQVEANLGPFRTAVELLISIPGIKNLGAHVIVSEIGIDMSRFPSARPSHLLGWHMSAQRRECRQASIQSPAQGCSLAQDHAGAVRLGSGKKERQLPAGPILPHQSPAWPQEGDHGRRRLHPYRHLPHAQGWDDVQGPWLQLLRSSFHRPAKKPPDQTLGRPWLRGADKAARRLRRLCDAARECVASPEQVSFLLGIASTLISEFPSGQSLLSRAIDRFGHRSLATNRILSSAKILKSRIR